jgi:hypothetical protein
VLGSILQNLKIMPFKRKPSVNALSNKYTPKEDSLDICPKK